MTTILYLKGQLEGKPLMEEFDDMVNIMNRAAGAGYTFCVTTKLDGGRIAFQLEDASLEDDPA
jgi:hypothetical protein